MGMCRIKAKSFDVFVCFFRPNSALLTMMKDQFANYVVQKVENREKKNRNEIFFANKKFFILLDD